MSSVPSKEYVTCEAYFTGLHTGGTKFYELAIIVAHNDTLECEEYHLIRRYGKVRFWNTAQNAMTGGATQITTLLDKDEAIDEFNKIVISKRKEYKELGQAPKIALCELEEIDEVNCLNFGGEVESALIPKLDAIQHYKNTTCYHEIKAALMGGEYLEDTTPTLEDYKVPRARHNMDVFPHVWGAL